MIRFRSCAAARWTSRLTAVLPPTSASRAGNGVHGGPDAVDGRVRGLAVRGRGQRGLEVGMAGLDHRRRDAR